MNEYTYVIAVFFVNSLRRYAHGSDPSHGCAQYARTRSAIVSPGGELEELEELACPFDVTCGIGSSRGSFSSFPLTLTAATCCKVHWPFENFGQ